MLLNPETEKVVAGFCHHREATIISGLPQRTFYYYLEQGLIPCYKIGRHKLFKRDEVIAAIMSHRVGTKAEALS
jgi:excisionase family DNA binding protein